SEAGDIHHAIANDEGGDRLESHTRYVTVARTEMPIAVGRYSSARYSLIRAEPMTGRMHQIRRHFAHLSHPLIGDTTYGS
ncbi:pseudouridine synthase, partial [Salmonella sp. SAL4355]|uniref:pseudouridine synthase n=1 Tax=Salmonella sp. SAL4355 TaxID=3159876 RepID=UPI003978498F